MVNTDPDPMQLAYILHTIASPSASFTYGYYPTTPTLVDVAGTGSRVWVRDYGPQGTPTTGHYRSHVFLIEFSATSQANLTALQNALLAVDSRNATGYKRANQSVTLTIASVNDDFDYYWEDGVERFLDFSGGAAAEWGNGGALNYFAYYCRFNWRIPISATITSAIMTQTAVNGDTATLAATDVNAIASTDIMNANGTTAWPDLTLATEALQLASWIGVDYVPTAVLAASAWGQTPDIVWVAEAEQTFDVTLCVQAIQAQANYLSGIGLRFGVTTIWSVKIYAGITAKGPTLTILFDYPTNYPYYLEMESLTYDDDPNRCHGSIQCTARWAI